MATSKVGGGNAGAAEVNAYDARRTSSSMLLDSRVLAANHALRALIKHFHDKARTLLAPAGDYWGKAGVLPAPGQYCFESPQVRRYKCERYWGWSITFSSPAACPIIFTLFSWDLIEGVAQYARISMLGVCWGLDFVASSSKAAIFSHQNPSYHTTHLSPTNQIVPTSHFARLTPGCVLRARAALLVP